MSKLQKEKKNFSGILKIRYTFVIKKEAKMCLMFNQKFKKPASYYTLSHLETDRDVLVCGT